jgi:hypothetical protein
MSKETTVSRTTPAMPGATAHAGPGSEKTGLAEQPHGVLRLIKAALRNAPMNCMSNGDGKKTGPWRTG